LLGILAPLSAQEAPLLPLQEAVTLALANNDELKTLVYEKEISANNVNPALAGKRPSIDFSGSLYYGYADGRAQTAGLGEPGQPNPPIELSGVKHGVSFGPEASWVVFDGGRGNNILESLRLLDQATALRIEAAREGVVAQVTNLYLRASQLAVQLDLDAANLDLTQERLARTERDERYGTSNSLRRLQARVDLSTDSITYRNTALALANAKRDLNLVMGREATVAFAVQRPRHPRPRPLNVDSLQTELLAHNENLAQARQRIAQTETEVKSVDLSNAVTVQAYVRGSYVNTTDNSNFLQENRNFGPEAGFRINKNIYDGGRRRIEAQNARIRVEQSLHEVEAIRRELLTRLRQAVADYDNNRAQLAAAIGNLPTFELNYEKTLTDFRLGQVDGTAVRTAQTNLAAA
ncbi:MAG: TolC family protein, partial [Bacteroidota bacterium]